MAETTKIQWTDHTHNPWIGCTKVHAGCTHCYAEADMADRRGRVVWGPHGTRSATSYANARKPLSWNRAAEKAGVRPRVFCASLADVFEDWQGDIVNHKNEVLYTCETNCDRDVEGVRVPFTGGECVRCHDPGRKLTMGDMRRDLFEMIDATPWLDWQLVTKRPENIRRMWPHRFTWREGRTDAVDCEKYRDNVWLLTSVSNQETADKQIPELLKCRDLVPVLGLSAEPLLGPIDLATDATVCDYCREITLDKNSWMCPCGQPLIQDAYTFAERLDWVIVGGESGHGARRCELEWIESIVGQCEVANVACFVKQLGSNPVSSLECLLSEVTDKKGGNWDEWPEEFRVRQFPTPDRSEP